MKKLLPLGGKYLGDNQCFFRVRAPLIPKVEVHLLSPKEKIIPLVKDGEYHQALVAYIPQGRFRSIACHIGKKDLSRQIVSNLRLSADLCKK